MSEDADEKNSWIDYLRDECKGHIAFASRGDGSMPGLSFWLELTNKQKAKCLTYFKMIASSPTLTLANRTKFKQVEGKLFELKLVQDQIRVFCFRREMTWYLIGGITGKKEDALPQTEVRKAVVVMEDCFRQLEM